MGSGKFPQVKSIITSIKSHIDVSTKQEVENSTCIVLIITRWIIALSPLGISTLFHLGHTFVKVPYIGNLWEYFFTPAGLLAFLSFITSFISVLILPGYFLLEMLFKSDRLKLLEKIPLSFVASLLILSIPGLISRIYLLPLIYFYWMFIVLYIFISLSWAINKNRHEFTSPKIDYRLIFPSLVLLLGIVVFLIWFPWWQPISNYDNWRYLAYIREDIDTYQLDDTDPVFGDVGTRYVRRYRYNVWLIDISLLSYSSGVDPIALTTGYLKLTMGLLSFITIYIVALELFANRTLAWLTVFIHMIYQASDRESYYGVGTLLNRMAEDKIIVGFIFLPLLAFLILRYWKGQDRWKYWLLFTFTVLLMVVFNQIGIVLAIFSIMSFILLRILIAGINREKVLLVPIIITFILALPWPLYLRTATTVGYTITEETDSSRSINDLLYIFHPGSYILHPNFISHPLVISSLILALPMVFSLRRSLAVQFILSNVFCYIVFLYVPFFTPLLGGVITPVILWRVSWILPVALINSYWIYKLVIFLNKFIPPVIQTPRVAVNYNHELILLLTILSIVFLLRDRIDRFPNVNWIDGNVPHDIANFLSEARSRTLLEGKVIAPREINLYIPGFWGSMFVMYDRPSVIPFIAEAVKDVEIFFSQNNFTKTHVGILNKNGISHIIVPNKNPLRDQFDYILSFIKIYSDDTYTLYKVNVDLQTSHLLLGDLHFNSGNWLDALSEYETAQKINENDIQSYLGLAQTYQILGVMEEALKFYRLALQLSNNENQVVAQIELRLNIDPMYLDSYLELGEAYRIGSESDFLESQWSIYNFLDHLADANNVSINPENISKTSFVIERRPEGVLFQHPPSAITFPQIYVSENHRLKFGLAINPMVWQVGRGDGVQFDIYLRNNHIDEQIFSIYIDPKNVIGERKWHDYEIDLSAWANQTTNVTFATSCGPNNNCDYDWAGWGEPRILQPISYNFLSELPNANIEGMKSELVRLDTLTIDYETRPILFQHPTSQVTYLVPIPKNSTLFFGLGIDPVTWTYDKGDGIEYSIYIKRLHEPNKLYRLFNNYYDPKRKPEDRKWSDHSLDLSDFGGETIHLIFETKPGPRGDNNYDWGGWSMPVLISGTSFSIEPSLP
jgi:tetratricopeptide (TPR) repeat protein